jgi:hypothetical protein
VELVRTIGPTSAFEAASSPKQVAVIIDRVTYMASCELLRPPTEVSLKRLISSISIGGIESHEEERLCVIGAILERQIDSLTGSLWKPEVQSAVAGLLSDCVSIYKPENRPIRRAGVMLRLLELSFYTGAPDGDTQLEKSADEIKALLSHEVRLLRPVVGIIIIYLSYRMSDEILVLRTCLLYIERKCTCGLPYTHIIKPIPNSTHSSLNKLRKPAAFLRGGSRGLPWRPPR